MHYQLKDLFITETCYIESRHNTEEQYELADLLLLDSPLLNSPIADWLIYDQDFSPIPLPSIIKELEGDL